MYLRQTSPVYDRGALDRGRYAALLPSIGDLSALLSEATGEGGGAEFPKRRGGGEPGFKSSEQRKQLEGLKNSLKRKLSGKQIEAFKKAVEDGKIGEQYTDKETLMEIFEDIFQNVKP